MRFIKSSAVVAGMAGMSWQSSEGPQSSKKPQGSAEETAVVGQGQPSMTRRGAQNSWAHKQMLVDFPGLDFLVTVNSSRSKQQPGHFLSTAESKRAQLPPALSFTCPKTHVISPLRETPRNPKKCGQLLRLLFFGSFVLPEYL
ncbi:hypothetical protein HGM15179_013003 [Zosterops borbonicus]|uniref:Uncharacterized protein n=1 Tax=Zosterops borbonicus TaxID=364589 RepID=A0A8K1G9K3_9PASS|nr:hypothetical protein HGM15179_013003 [Zosterops borbonicus]